MENLVFTQLSIPEIRQLLRDELEQFFARNPTIQKQPQTDEFGGIELAMQITGYARPTIYSLTAKRIMPHSKPSGKKLYFSRRELLEWMASGKRKTQTEIAADAENFRAEKVKEAARPTKNRNRFRKV